jgi:hypothetical protein
MQINPTKKCAGCGQPVLAKGDLSSHCPECHGRFCQGCTKAIEAGKDKACPRCKRGRPAR